MADPAYDFDNPDPNDTLKFLHDARSTLTAIQGAFELILLSETSARNTRLAKAGQAASIQLERLLDGMAAADLGHVGISDPMQRDSTGVS